MNPESNNLSSCNVSNHLRRMAKIHPHKRAVVYPAAHDKYGRVAYSHLTFQQLDLESDCYAYGLEKAGIKQGTRTVLMVKPGIEFFTLTFAIFKVGAVPVVVDPGMGISRMLRCLEESRPNAFIGIPIAHALKKTATKIFQNSKNMHIPKPFLLRSAVSDSISLLPVDITGIASVAP